MSPVGVTAEVYKAIATSHVVFLKTRVKAVSVFLAGSQTCFQRMFGSAGGCPLSQFLFVISMIRTQSTAGGEDIVEFVDFKIASLLFACCHNPDNGGVDGLLMDFAIHAIGHDHLIISIRHYHVSHNLKYSIQTKKTNYSRTKLT